MKCPNCFTTTTEYISDSVMVNGLLFKDARAFEDYIPLNDESYIIEQCTGLKDKQGS